MDTSLLLKMKGRIEILSSEPESKFHNEAYSVILDFLSIHHAKCEVGAPLNWFKPFSKIL